jgi:hypothetical protein
MPLSVGAGLVPARASNSDCKNETNGQGQALPLQLFRRKPPDSAELDGIVNRRFSLPPLES